MGLQDHDEMAHRSVLQFRMEEEQVLRLLFPSLFSYPDFNSSLLIEGNLRPRFLARYSIQKDSFRFFSQSQSD